MLCGDLEGGIDVIDRKGNAVHPDLVRQRRACLDGTWMNVLEELQLTLAVRGLEHGNFGVVAVEAYSCVRPFPTDRVTTQYRQPEVGEKRNGLFQVANGDAYVLEFDRHVPHVTNTGTPGHWRK